MHKRIPIFLGFLLVALGLWLQTTNIDYLQRFIYRLEELAYDVQLRTKIFTHPASFQTSVAIVDIDDKSLAKEGRWPWPRHKIAQLVSRLQDAGAVVIAFDIMFSEPEENIVDRVISAVTKNNLMTSQIEPVLNKIQPFFNNDSDLAETLKKSDTVLSFSLLPRNVQEGMLPNPVLTLTTPIEKSLDFISALGYVSNIPILASAAKSGGFINVFSDEDGIIRRVPILMRYQNNLYPSVPFEAVRVYLLSNVKLDTGMYRNSIRLEGVELGDHKVPTDEKAQMIIPFRGKSYTYPYFSATNVLNNQIPQQAFAGKIVFIGTSATGMGDLKPTAIDPAFPGVEIEATIADAILTNNFSFRPPWAIGVEIFLTCLLGVICASIFPYFGPRLLAIMIVFIPIGLMLANNELWQKTGLIVSIFIPIILTLLLALMNILYGYLFETRKREHLKTIFGQYVPEKHIDEMLKTSGSYGMTGEDREMTVLFADIRNFTTISEHVTASQLKEMLNDFFTPMTEVIFKHRGTIDKYVGDLIMAFWGAPLKDKRHAQHAVSAAIEMQEAVKNLEPELREHGWPALHIGIGLNSGLMTVGDMGSKFRRNYTVLGDAVNLASRVESLSKFYGVKIVVTEFTKDAVADHKHHFTFRQLDRVRVKGKEKAVGLFEVVGRRGHVTAELIQESKMSDSALNFYFNRDWNKARELFTELYNAHPEVKFYEVYLDRIKDFEKNPPASDWDGVYIMHEK